MTVTSVPPAIGPHVGTTVLTTETSYRNCITVELMIMGDPLLFTDNRISWNPLRGAGPASQPMLMPEYIRHSLYQCLKQPLLSFLSVNSLLSLSHLIQMKIQSKSILLIQW